MPAEEGIHVFKHYLKMPEEKNKHFLMVHLKDVKTVE